ncbi:synaptonemal complex central element protein 1-like isoform X2 [Sus scrofa]|uniref:synaptonemal complex central element protein 1-like isoform X2 n=1 Tax=Sus scrofa TaxID=9823 RepID=UPI0006B1EF02|nr:synaptonemal complex central element protein 1-like isoform X2 [Sus scrofa]
MRAVQLSHCPSVCFCFFKTNPHPKRRRTSLALEMAMAGELEHVDLGPPEVVEEVEEAEGQTKSLKKTEDLLEMVKKLQKEGSLEPQIEDLINRINELQQAKKKSSEELGEAHAVWKALHRELDSLNGEKVHLEEILSKKQEALRILQLHCQRKEGEAQRKYMLAEHADQISIHNSQIAESQGQRKLGWHVELLEASRGQHKDLWEFHMLKQRLAWEIRALQSSKEQLLTEERQARAKLEEVEQRLRSPPEVPGASAEKDGLKAELEKLGGRSPPRPRAPQKSEPANERPARK